MPTAEELAYQMGTPGKTLRSWLRKRYPRHVHGGPWIFTSKEADEIRREYRAKSSASNGGRWTGLTTATTPAPTSNRDEAYVIDLCDQLLGTAAERQHRFDWLRGDPNSSGNRRMLPVDAYYPTKRLVVEYLERQHSETVAHFDKPDGMTVSGVHRGDQRRLYDERRRTEIPAHGLTLICVDYSDLVADAQGRLLRREPDDLRSLRSMLQQFL